MEEKLSHLTGKQLVERSALLSTHPEVCQSPPGQVSLTNPGVDMGDVWSIEQ